MTTERPDSEYDPTISASALEKLAERAERVGATRYAEAYRLVAKRLRELAEFEDVQMGKR